MEEIYETWTNVRPHYWKSGSLTYSQTDITKLGFKGWPINLPKLNGMEINMTITNCHTILPKGARRPKKKRSKSAPIPQLPDDEQAKLQKAVELYAELFTDKESTWDSVLED